MRTPNILLASVLLLLALGACAPNLAGEDPANDADGVDFDVDEIRSVGSPPWIYNGLLPALVRPRMFVSLNGLTVRVVGEAPVNFTGPLPYYAGSETVAGRRMITVVYPIATGQSSRLDAPGTYSSVTATPYRPNGMAYPSSGPTFVRWGGFPFINYNGGIALHGPITWTPEGTQNGVQMYEWYLQRGPVSHGCNRMQGEHVVELAHLMGVNMRNTWTAGRQVSRALQITVTRDFDRLESGEIVDVDYPRIASAMRPTGATRVFPTWRGEELTRNVCQDNRTSRVAGTIVGNDFCNYMPENVRDVVTGEARGPIEIDNTDAAFSKTGAWFATRVSPNRTGMDYQALNAGASGTATWQLPVQRTRRYAVWARYAAASNRNTHATYRVFGDASTNVLGVPVIVNQRVADGARGWVLLGEYTLSAGARVTLASASPTGAESDGYTLADAIRIDPVE